MLQNADILYDVANNLLAARKRYKGGEPSTRHRYLENCFNNNADLGMNVMPSSLSCRL